jgi:ABC-type transport system substrate-binding protein
MLDIITEPQDPRSSQFAAWFELLWCDDMTLDREIFSFQTNYTPVEYLQGWLAESWEQTDPLTWTVKIREGVHWQDKAPTYGREFTAEDVQYSYDRVLGKGEFEGQPPNGFYVSFIPNVDRVVATDKYTVEFQLNAPTALVAHQIVGPFLGICLVPPEWVELTPEEQQDWQNCIGTGAFVCTDFVPGTSLLIERNPDYWGYDERHPDNQLPYLDAIKVLAIPDMATALAAMRSGKLDMVADGRSYASLAEAESLAENFPDIVQYEWLGNAAGVYFKWNTEPFTDIRVRKAMQLAINVPEIAETHYRGAFEGIPCGLSSPKVGEDWAVPYDQWPADLQAEYSYDPDTAKALLTEAGFPNGFETEILAATVDDMTLLQILKSYFADIGITMEIEAMDMITNRTAVMSGNYNQMIYAGGGGGTAPPDMSIGNFWSKKMERVGGEGGVIDPEYDVLVEEFFAATEMAEAQRIYREAERYLLEKHYTLTVCPIITKQLGQPWLKGWNGEMFWSSWGWAYWSRFWIDESLK